MCDLVAPLLVVLDDEVTYIALYSPASCTSYSFYTILVSIYLSYIAGGGPQLLQHPHGQDD